MDHMRHFIVTVMVLLLSLPAWTNPGSINSPPLGDTTSTAVTPPPQTIAEAVAQVSSIQHPDPATQTRMRADAARAIVQNRVFSFNGPAGYFLQTLPIDAPFPGDSVLSRTEQIMAERARQGGDPGGLAWQLGVGACNEHSDLVSRILRGAGENVQVFMSDAGHALPVVGLPPDADPDIPSTWGPNAIIPDSWLGETLTPQEAWNEGWIFNDGEAHVSGPNTRLPTRATLEHILSQGPDYLSRPNVWERYVELINRLPADMLADFTFPDGSLPPDPNGPRPGSDGGRDIERGTYGQGGRGGGPLGGPGLINPNGGINSGGHSHGPQGQDIPTSGGGCGGY